jgi:hypothetical protein
MNEHRRIQLQMYDYLTAGLTPEEDASVRTHLEQCVSCRESCDELRTLLTALPGPVDYAGRLPSAFWTEILNDVMSGLPERTAEKKLPHWFRDWVEFVSLPRHQWVIGIAVTLLLLGALTGTWLAMHHDMQPQQTAAVTAMPDKVQVPAVNARLKQYLRKSKALLVGINNMPLAEGKPVDLSLERTMSRSLLHEARYLEEQPLDDRSAALLRDLEKIQIALANSKEREEIPGFQLIRGGIQEENLLFKIRIAETVYERLDNDRQHGQH